MSRLRRPCRTAVLLSLLLPGFACAGRWPLWDNYAQFFVQEGRVVDFDRASCTTSEGQSYALFFALVANDVTRFERILAWTRENLAQGDLRKCLPAWRWGKTRAGTWQVLDVNTASDADLWLAYTLLQAGRLWKNPNWTEMGQALADLIAEKETAVIPGFGTALLPGATGFHPQPDVYYLNPSYVPIQTLIGLGAEQPMGPWAEIANSTPKLLSGSAPHGFALDWVCYKANVGFTTQPIPAPRPAASYDAIRVYLWAGMLPAALPSRGSVLGPLSGMAGYLRKQTYPPVDVAEDGQVRDPKGGPGFSAAVAPFLRALGEEKLAKQNLDRLASTFDLTNGLFGKPPHYYDQNLALFALGWTEGRYRFDENGRLAVPWRQ